MNAYSDYLVVFQKLWLVDRTYCKLNPGTSHVPAYNVQYLLYASKGEKQPIGTRATAEESSNNEVRQYWPVELHFFKKNLLRGFQIEDEVNGNEGNH